MGHRVLVIGTRNRKKRDELISLLGPAELDILTLDAFADAPQVLEDGRTFLENATKKSVTLAKALGQWVLGEDSGLAVDALGGAPGIYSARYAGDLTDDQRNNAKLLAELEGVPEAHRGAHFACAAAVADPAGIVRAHAEGRCDGRIALESRGTGGFGYDPIFLLTDLGRTFGELPAEVKRRRSHRAAAIRALRPQVVTLLQTEQW